MKKLLIILAIFFFYGCASKKVNKQLFYDGVYQSEKVDDYWYYIKFYPDKSLIGTTTNGTPTNIKEWFKKEEDFISRGFYKIKKDSIFFDLTSGDGIVKYKGKIAGKKLILNSESLINGHKEKNIFTYVNTDD